MSTYIAYSPDQRNIRGTRQEQCAPDTLSREKIGAGDATEQPRASDLARHSEEMLPSENDPHAAFQNQAQRGEMNCALLAWAASQDHLSPHLQGILVRLVRLMDADGMIAMPQAQIAPRISLGETQTRAAIKALVAAGAIARRRRGSIGGGRASDLLTANLERQHDTADTPTLSSDNSEGAAVSRLSTKKPDNSGSDDNTEPSTVSQNDNSDSVEGSPVDNSGARMSRHARDARAAPDKTTTQVLEFYPERAEQTSTAAPKILNGSAKGMPGHELAAIIVERVNSRWLDPHKHQSLGRSIGRIPAWMNAGADFDADIMPTILAICGRATEPIRTWGYFTDAIRKATAQRLASEEPLIPITAEEANAYVNATRKASTSNGRGERRSRLTDRYHELLATDQPLDLGRVDSVAIK